jgi:hypothetical protein
MGFSEEENIRQITIIFKTMKLLARFLLFLTILDLFTLIRDVMLGNIFTIENLIGLVLIIGGFWFFEKYRNGIK